MLYGNVKLEERGDKDPKFNPKNKTDRKILIFVLVSVAILLILIAALVAVYYLFFHGGAGTLSSSSIVE